MNLRSFWPAILIVAFPATLFAQAPTPYQTDFPPEEFRRAGTRSSTGSAIRASRSLWGHRARRASWSPGKRTSSTTSAGSRPRTLISSSTAGHVRPASSCPAQRSPRECGGEGPFCQ